MAKQDSARLAVEGGLVVAFDGERHGLMPGAALVVEGDTVSYVGYHPPSADVRVPAEGRLVIPGMINLEACTYLDIQNFATDSGHPNYFGPSGFNFAPTLAQLEQPAPPEPVDEKRARLGAAYGLMQALQGGATTVVGADYRGSYVDSQHGDLLAEVAAELGVRAYLAPAYGAATHYVTEQGGGDFYWDREQGARGLARNLEFARRLTRLRADNPEADVHAMLFPYRADAMDESLLRDTKAAASEAGLRIRMHAAQFLMEYYEQVRRTAESPIEFLHRVGFLGPEVLLHHTILTAEHSWIPRTDGRDIELLAETGTSVGHCPTIFARRAVMLESFDRHLRAGVNIGLGTDTVPQDMFMVMRWAAALCKIAERNVNVGTAPQVFHAATVAGADALGRSDLGRLRPGSKADFVIVRIDSLRSGPIEDPLRNLINCCTSADIESVWIGGRKVVDRGRLVGVDEVPIMNVMRDEIDRKRARLASSPTGDRFPPSLPVWEELPSP